MFKKNNMNFNIYNKKFLLIGILMFIQLIFVLFADRIGFNKGIDFAGGIVVESVCEKCNIQVITKEISKKIGSNIQSQETSTGFLLKTTETKEYEKTLSTVKNVLKKHNAKVVSNDFVSPQMTKTFIKDSIIACIFAFVCIGIYVFFRFNWKFAISAIIALVYDVLFVVCFISIIHIEVCLITLTAILTIIGYCINDKIVVMDRIKSNLDEVQKSTYNIVASSVKNVLTRSVITSFTTAIVSLSLLFFGDRLIYDFGITIIFGIFVGTISSLILVPSLLLAFNIEHRKNKNIVKDPMWYAS